MKFLFVLLLIISIAPCNRPRQRRDRMKSATGVDFIPNKSYNQTKEEIENKRKEFSVKYPSVNAHNPEKIQQAIIDYWVSSISNDLFNQWQNTPWDFNGTASRPNKEPIACGYFVTAILLDMSLKIDRRKLSVFTSSAMMKSLTPNQKLKNLSHLSYRDFYKTLKHFGKGVYIIGLDFHTGFIVNDGKEVWFIYSNYIKRKGVTKENILNSVALQSSKTRWMICLTHDRDFLYKWLKG